MASFFYKSVNLPEDSKVFSIPAYPQEYAPEIGKNVQMQKDFTDAQNENAQIQCDFTDAQNGNVLMQNENADMQNHLAHFYVERRSVQCRS
jgi:hypothetical protein